MSKTHQDSAAKPLEAGGDAVWYLESVRPIDGAKRHVTLSPFPFRVGRSSDSGLWLLGSRVSKAHAEFLLRDGKLLLRDLGSTNGTYLNAERIGEESSVAAGDVVHFGDQGFTLCCWPVNTAATTHAGLPLQAALKAEVDERRRTAEALHNCQAHWEAVFDSAPDGILTTDRRGAIESFNAAAERLFGYEAGEIIGVNINGLLPRPFRLEHDASLEAALRRSGRSAVQEVQARRKDGSLFPAAIALGRMSLTNGRAFVGIVRDITRQKAAQRRLQEARAKAERDDRARAQFLADMSHEIRAPLTAILGYVDLLMDATSPPQADSPAMLEAVRRNGRHMLTVVNDVLDLSKHEAGLVTVEAVPCSLVELIRDVRQLAARPGGVPLLVDCERLPPRAVTDPIRLKQVLVNLVGNALKFTQTGHVRLSGRLEHGSESTPHLVFTVKDTGIGMSEEEIGLVFEPFAQAGSSAGGRHGGTGLGLAIARRIVASLNGEIEVESRPGEGSTFHVRLPYVADDGADEIAGEAGRRAPAPLPPPPRPLSEASILMADDSPDVRRIVSLWLESAGASVTAVADGQEALAAWDEAAAAESEFDLVLLDVQMPALDGCAAARRLRDRGCQTPIVALTARRPRDEPRQPPEAAFTLQLCKPVQQEELIHRLGGLLTGVRIG